MGRIYDTRIIQYNGCFQELLGLKRIPEAFDLERILEENNLAESQGIIRVHDLLRRKIWNLPHSSSSLIFDLDSTVLPVFGWRIEGAKVGYNPAKPGRPSYHPLICFEGHTRYLVRLLAFRRCPFRERSSSALGGLPKENSQIPLPHQNSRQLGILRPQVHRAARRGKRLLMQSWPK